MSFQVGWGTAKFKRFIFAFIAIALIMLVSWYFEIEWINLFSH